MATVHYQPSPRYLLRRKVMNSVTASLAVITTLCGLALPCWILFTVIYRGFGALNIGLLTQMTPPPDAAGGLLNAIIGTLLMVGLSTLLAAPIGVIAGIYLAEYGRRRRVAIAIRFVNDILLSAPSIVLGLLVYMLVVVPFHHFSGYAGIIALALISLPIIVRTTESMLLLVPDSVREGAIAMGASSRQMIFGITLIGARNGIITGILLSIARVSGETAPLLFTALNNQFYSLNLNQPMANLPVVIFQFAMSPYENWQSLAWAGAALIALSVAFINLIVRAVFRTHKTLSLS